MGVTEERLREFLEPYARGWVAFRGDAWGWVRACMRTRNEDAGRGRQTESVPVPDLPHLRVLVWFMLSVRLGQVDKSRQMMATWMTLGMYVWKAMFTPSARIGYQHITAGETSEKLERYFLYILARQPMTVMLPWVEERGVVPEAWTGVVAEFFGLSRTPPSPPRADQPASFGSEAYQVALRLCNRYRTASGSEGLSEIYLYPYFEPDERLVEAIPAGPKGPNKWRGSTRTDVAEDEAWFHQSLSDNVNSALKSAGQNGQQFLVSTANPGEDGDGYPLKMVEKAAVQPETFGGHNGHPTMRADEMPHGVEIWLTAMGYTHLRIWYYADPTKRGPEWYQHNVLTGDRRKNQREVLISYAVPSGDPFYPSFNPESQSVKVLPGAGNQLVVCMDGGRKPAAVVLQVTPAGRVLASLEVVTAAKFSSNVTTLAGTLVGALNLRFPGWKRDHVLVLDPSMFDTRSETDDRTSAQVLTELGFYVVKGSQNPENRYRCVTELNSHLLMDEYGNRPALLVDAGGCPTLYQGLSGSCVVAKNAEKVGANVKEKNIWSHVVEALEYGATYLDAQGGAQRYGGYGDEAEAGGALLTHNVKR